MSFLMVETEKDAPKAITRADIAEKIYQQIGLSRLESGALVDKVIDLIVDALLNQQEVKISSFGSFYVRQKGSRPGRNPKTLEVVNILPRRVLSFKASHTLKDLVNESLTKPKDVSGGAA